jgi:biotin carboxyl carrier protein
MTFEVEINGRVRTVSIESLGAAGPAGGRFHVVVHESGGDAPGEPRPFAVDVRRTEIGLSLLQADEGRSVDAALTEQARGAWFVQLPHVALTATIDGRRYERGPSGESAGSGVQRVVAPMPGRVVRVLVQPGDEVALRQGLVVVEAMKMENELRAPKAGRVKEVAVAEGASVEAGRLLVVVE